MSALQQPDQACINAGVYRIDSPSGGFYIGSSIDVERRFEDHRRDLRKGKHVNQILQRSADKYGVDRLVFSRIAGVLRVEDVRTVEQIVMDDLAPPYNISKNAYSAIFDESVVAKRVATVSKPVVRLTDGVVFKSGYEAARVMGAERERNQIFTALKNGWKWLGHYWKYADDSKSLADAEMAGEAMEAERKRNAAIGASAARSKAVTCLNTGISYASCRIAETTVGIHKGGVSRSATKHTVAGGCFWRFADEVASLHEVTSTHAQCEKDSKEKRAKALVAKLNKRVRCIETGEMFDSVSSATKSKGIGRDSVRQSITGGRKISGLSWEYVDA